MAENLLSDVFFQANTIKGYRYLDDAGKVMNKWDSDFPDKTVGVQGLVMSNPSAELRELKVDTKQVWMHYTLPKNIRAVIESTKTITTEICTILGVESFDRVGLRVQYAYGVTDLKESINKIAGKMLNSEWWEKVRKDEDAGFQVLFPIGTKELTITLAIAIVKRALKDKEAKKIPENAILFDMDIYHKGKYFLDDLTRFMKLAQVWIETDFPKLQSFLVGEGGKKDA